MNRKEANKIKDDFSKTCQECRKALQETTNAIKRFYNNKPTPTAVSDYELDAKDLGNPTPPSLEREVRDILNNQDIPTCDTCNEPPECKNGFCPYVDQATKAILAVCGERVLKETEQVLLSYLIITGTNEKLANRIKDIKDELMPKLTKLFGGE